MLHQDGNIRLGEMSHGRNEGRKEGLVRKLRTRRIGKTEMDGEAWLIDEARTWKSLMKRKNVGGEYEDWSCEV
jgi:hypothetical protein